MGGRSEPQIVLSGSTRKLVGDPGEGRYSFIYIDPNFIDCIMKVILIPVSE